ncbi:MAG: SCO family protein [Amaricoccus sp.]|uniref:SCO family protein n=1 Tax=Amaricoccus sp. TaxID=1872485 RepID=UPI0039E21959
MTRVSAIVAAAVAVVGLAIGGWFALRPADGDPFADCRRGAVAAGAASIGGPFTLTDTDGRRVTDADVVTGPTLVYFGYTFCPDICPTDVSRNALAAADLAEKGVDVRQAFITIDPDRDTPEAVRAFTSAIDPAIVGLSGSAEDIAAAAKAYKVYYRKAGDDPEFYLMDHSTFTYLMAPGAGFLEFYPSDTPAEDMAQSVACFTEKL